MRNSLPLLSRPLADSTNNGRPNSAGQPLIPSIHLINATPPAMGHSSAASLSIASNTINSRTMFTSRGSSPPSGLAPKPSAPASKPLRVVPKKSRLGLLSVVSGNRDKENRRADDSRPISYDSQSHDLSIDEIYVDPTFDPDIGEIIMVKKKKSRAALDGMHWGPLGEVTNVPAAGSSKNGNAVKEIKENKILKVKGEEKEKEKWWTIGRGRKDSKDKAKEGKENKRGKSPESTVFPIRSKTPEPFRQNTESRARFNSLDAGILLKSPVTAAPASVPIREPEVTLSRSGTPTAGVTFSEFQGTAYNNQGSIAVRAMRSVRSLARIGGWAQMRKESGSHDEQDIKKAEKETKKEKKTKKEKEKETEKKERKEKKEKKETKKKEKKETEKEKKETEKKEKKSKKEKKQKDVDKEKKAVKPKESTSSFEVGALSPARPSSPPPPLDLPNPPASFSNTIKEGSRTLSKKVSILGLGFPSTMRLPSLRSGSGASSIFAGQSQTTEASREHVPSRHSVDAQSGLSAESSVKGMGFLGRGRSGSVLSTGSSLRPLSTISNHSRTSTASGVSSSIHSSHTGCSVRWDEEGLETVKKTTRRERAERAKDEMKDEKKGKKAHESKRPLEGRKRTAITDIFPDVGSRRSSAPDEAGSRKSSFGRQLSVQGPVHGLPLLTVEEATSASDYDGPLGSINDVGTPSKRARPRPLSEQLLGRSRPTGVYQDDDGALSILDAATNDLAQLIMTLNLEATPCNTPSKTQRCQPPGFNACLDENLDDRMPDSPLQKTLKKSMASITSLRAYSQSLKRSGSRLLLGSPNDTIKKKPSKIGSETLIGQQIAPWSKLVEGLSPKKASLSSAADRNSISRAGISRPTSLRPSVSPPNTFRKTHRRQMTPAPEPEPAPEFQPLRPAARPKIKTAVLPSTSANDADSSIEVGRGAIPVGATLSKTFGSPSRALGTKKSSSSKDRKVPIPPETRRALGMSGTLGRGGSNLSTLYAMPEMDASDPDSDIPDELQFILSTSNADGAAAKSAVAADDENETFSFPLPADEKKEAKEVKKGSAPRTSVLGLPPVDPLPIPSSPPLRASLPMELPPVFRARIIDVDEHHTKIQYSGEREVTSEEDTGKSFDFTGELKKLDASGESDRKSFVEQLENAFKTPPKVELTFDLMGRRMSTLVDAPPIPTLPFAFPEAQGKKKEDTTSRPASGFDSQAAVAAVTTITEESSDDSMVLHGTESVRSEGDEQSSSLNMSTTTNSSSRSNGELNTLFKFGGKLKPSPAASEKMKEKPLTLSDIIPPLSHARSLSESSFRGEEEDLVLKSIYAKAKTGGAQPRSRLSSNASAKRKSRFSTRSFLPQSRPSSMLSFTGLDSFEDLWRNFEFGGPRPAFYPTTAPNGRVVRESLLSIASISSYGRVINPGINDPFGFTLPSLEERNSIGDMSSATFSFSIDDTFSFIHRPSRRIRVDSDASSFYFRPPLPNTSQNRMSFASPPVSFYTRTFGSHRKTDSTASTSSAAPPYATHGATGGRPAWAKHRHDPSIDSVMSDASASAVRLGRPGIGDKMFETSFDQGIPLSSTSSPPHQLDRHSISPPEYVKNSYASTLDVSDELRLSDDSLFDKTGHRTSLTSDMFFGNDPRSFQPRYRPLSVLSLSAAHPPVKEDDTWISMIGGGGDHVRRNSVASAIQTSPCTRVEKRKNTHLQPIDDLAQEHLSPKKARIVEKPSIVSTSSSKFGGERMVKAAHGLFQRQGLEESCLVAEGEDASLSFRSAPVFSRPVPAGRSRSSTCTSSSGGDTPPLSSDGSSISGDSQSSIDLAHLNSLLANVTFPMGNIGTIRNRARPRARGQGHRRQYSAARASRTSVYETIEEEAPNMNSPTHTLTFPKSAASPTTTIQPVFIVDSDTGSMDVTVSDAPFWDSDKGPVTLTKYYALRSEVEETVIESKKQWADTPFSIFAVQNFQPPRNPEGMKALLQHSVQNFGPLPSELRPHRRSRRNSRASPYPLARVSKVFYPPEPKHTPTSPPLNQSAGNTSILQVQPVLHERPVNLNVPPSPAPSFKSKVLSPQEPNTHRAPFGHPPIRPRVASTARKGVFGWAKRSVKLSNGGDQKENTENKENRENVSYGSIKAPGESLRLNRPRPRGRAAPATQQRSIRV